MESSAVRRPKMRREKNLIVEENVDAVRWPHECSGCGGTVDQMDVITLSKKHKTLGEIRVELAGIPYCRACFAKSRAARRLDSTVWTLALVLGIPLGCLLIVSSAQRAAQSASPTLIWFALYFVIAIAIGYGVAWLFVKFPLRALFRSRFVEPVEAWLIDEKKSDGRDGLSLVIAIPNRMYAGKFALLNGVP